MKFRWKLFVSLGFSHFPSAMPPSNFNLQFQFTKDVESNMTKLIQ